MPATCDAVVAGHLCLDVIPDLHGRWEGDFATRFVPGRLLDVGPVMLSTGGAVSNAGLALHRLGISTLLMGKIGDDLFGHAVRQVIMAYAAGPSTRSGQALTDALIVDRSVATSYTIIINPPGVDRIFLHCPAANDSFGADDVRYDVLSAARLFHFGYPPLMKRMYAEQGRELVEIFRRARAAGVTTSLDLALPDPASPAGRADWLAILAAVLPDVDIFLPSIEEILYMLRRETYEALRPAGVLAGITPDLLSDLAREILAMGVRVLALKLGDRGLYVRTTADAAALAGMGRGAPADAAGWAGRELWAPCFQVQVAGATGAGDATVAGLLSGLLRGLSLQAAVQAAVGVGACNVEAPDALSGLRTWEETLQRIETGWPQHALELAASGWRYDAVQRLWVGPG
ncbi:MAG: carbohydrate kinase family protein [Chloroflexi bacterium]|nr:carbohydrate kinase family protein [Chloroflexota bacterium]